MKPAVVFPDARKATLDVIRAALPAYVEGLTASNFGTILPDVEETGGPPLPYVYVAHDGTPSSRYVVTESATIRVVVWHGSDDRALALAQVVRALLLSYEGGPDVRSFGRLAGPLPTTDPASGSPLAYFTVAARLRPSTL